MAMDLQESLRSLRELDVSDLTLDNIGSWPVPIKVILCIVVFAAVLAAGWYFHVQDLRLSLERTAQEEVKLRGEFEKKAFQVANLDAYRRQMAEMEETFGALLAQLPSDTEVPGLLEDITNRALMNGLTIGSINLQDEVSREFYVELPISIVARGSYHDLGAFVSGMAGLPRIVTLHDFVLSGQGETNNILNINITAKTYRYKDGST